MSCSGAIEKCSVLERQKLSAEDQLEVLTQRLNGILGLLCVDTVLPSIEDMVNKVCYFFTSENNISCCLVCNTYAKMLCIYKVDFFHFCRPNRCMPFSKSQCHNLSIFAG